ncbi:hypothetical protein [Streptomyces sp. BE133]|uniref:hypothetical protein n=1 Tax=Streptomyces sp. BE133 TaxID=3002523 RepID=UPI002E78BFB3|nr:hypothetical protein [Streptomyces sp. BE133]MEE1811286.1 hypothetical protein [Streptomyces sp. BE133]
MAEELEAPSVDGRPIDKELIGDNLDTALDMTLSTSTREDINWWTATLIGHLNLLVGEELGADDIPEVKSLFSEAYKLLDLRHRPTNETPTLSAFNYLRQTGLLTRRFLTVYSRRRGTGCG